MTFRYRTKAFVLDKKDSGEQDRIFSVFSEDFGKIEVLGKAIRKIRAKLRFGIDLFYFSEIEFIQGKARKTLVDAIPVEVFKNIKGDYEKLKTAYKISKTLADLVNGQEKDEKIFDLLNKSFSKLNNCFLFAVDCDMLYYYFLWNLISILGYKKDFYNCVSCSKKLLPENLYFNFKEGGIIDSECFYKIKDGTPVLPETIKILRIFIKNDWDTLQKIKARQNYIKPLEEISDFCLSFYKEKNSYKKIIERFDF